MSQDGETFYGYERDAVLTMLTITWDDNCLQSPALERQQPALFVLLELDAHSLLVEGLRMARAALPNLLEHACGP